jgi:hypothetical protein
MLAGAGVAGRVSANEGLFFAATLCGFMMYVPLQVVLRDRFLSPVGDQRRRDATFWSLAFGLTAAGCGVALFFSGYTYLLPLGLGAVSSFVLNFLLTRYFQKSVLSDLMAVAGLTLGAPGMYYIAVGHFGIAAFSLWVLTFLFFGSSVFYVHMKMKAAGAKKADWSAGERMSIGRLNLLYHLFVLTTLVVMALLHLTPLLIILAFVPITLHAFVGTFRLSGVTRYKTLGFLLLGQSLVFCLLLVLIERL